MGRFLWAWCFAALLLVGLAASARAQEGMIVAVCVRPPEIPEDIARNGWAFAPDAVTVVRMPRKDFKEASRGKLVYHFDPAAPPANTRLLPIRYHHLQCAPYQPPPSPPPASSAAPSAGPPPPPPPPRPAAAGTSSAASKPAKDKPAKDKPAATAAEDAPFPPPQPIVYPKTDQEPKPHPPSGGVTEHWPSTVLPITRRPVDTRAKVLPVATVLPVTQPEVDTHTKVLPATHVLPNKYDVAKPGKGGEGSGDGDGHGDAPIKVAKKDALDKVSEELAYAGAIANQQLNEDTRRPDGKQYGIPGGKNPNGPNHPLAQAAAGAVLVVAGVVSAGNFEKKLMDAIKKKTPLLITEKMLTREVAEEIATKYGAHAADALAKNGAIGPYSVMKRFTEKLGGRWQAHHILEVRFARKFKLGNPDRLPSVILTEAEHKAITAKLNAKTPKVKDAEELWQAYQDVYKNYPHWLDAIKSYFARGK